MRFIAVIASAFMLIAMAASASLGQIGDASAPLDIDAEHMDTLDAERRIILRGDVVIVQGTSSIRADRIDVYYDGSGSSETSSSWGDIERIVATDNVFYVTPRERARGDLGVYNMQSETITLTGDVVITQCENVITTNRFVTDLVSGNSSFGDQQTGERVRVLLMPQSDDAPVRDDGC
jgi:lipopolysaccharide export system protein LptA